MRQQIRKRLRRAAPVATKPRQLAVFGIDDSTFVLVLRTGAPTPLLPSARSFGCLRRLAWPPLSCAAMPQGGRVRGRCSSPSPALICGTGPAGDAEQRRRRCLPHCSASGPLGDVLDDRQLRGVTCYNVDVGLVGVAVSATQNVGPGDGYHVVKRIAVAGRHDVGALRSSSRRHRAWRHQRRPRHPARTRMARDLRSRPRRSSGWPDARIVNELSRNLNALPR